MSENFCNHCSHYTGKYCRLPYCDGAFNNYDASDGKTPGTGYAESNEEYNLKKDKLCWIEQILKPGNFAYSNKYELNFKNDIQVDKLRTLLKYQQQLFDKHNTQYIGIEKFLKKLETPPYYVSEIEIKIMWLLLLIEETYYMGEYPKTDRFEFINEIKEMQNVYSTAKKLNNANEK